MRDIGSATKLMGNCLCVAVFVSEDGNPWDQEAKDSILAQIDEANEWIKSCASEYEIDVSFDKIELGYESDVVIDKLPDGPQSGYQEYVQKIADFLEISDEKALRDYIVELYGSEPDNIYLLLFANKTGRGFALPYYEGGKDDYLLESTFLFKQSGDYALKTATIAHETLHLFGAFDLYANKDSDKPREAKAREYYPQEIMLETKFNINENILSEVTAFFIGWHEDKQDWYMELMPPEFVKYYHVD